MSNAFQQLLAVAKSAQSAICAEQCSGGSGEHTDPQCRLLQIAIREAEEDPNLNRFICKIGRLRFETVAGTALSRPWQETRGGRS